jgi:hypothetical protein
MLKFRLIFDASFIIKKLGTSFFCGLATAKMKFNGIKEARSFPV